MNLSGLDRESLVRWSDTLAVAPRLAVAAVPAALLPAGASLFSTARAEGLSDLHWKVLGDSLVRFFQRAGPVTTKLGQTLATRGDLLPQALCDRLERLYSAQPAMSSRQLERVLSRAYPEGRPFRRFCPEPIAVGSIGQVHRARLRNGRCVVVKVLRPGIERALRRDLNAARTLTELFFTVGARSRVSSRRLVTRTIEDLSRALELEANLELEGQNLAAFREDLAGNPKVYVPICYAEHSSRDVLVIEELRGRPLSKVRRGRNRRDARRVAGLALREILGQIFDGGRFHADPHGGNLWLLPDGRLGLIDLGLCGELRLEDRKRVTRAARAFLSGDADGAIESLLEFGSLAPEFDLAAFKRDVHAALRARRSARTRGADARLETLVNDLLSVAAKHEIYLPPSTTLLIKTLVTIEGVARSLDPNINVVVTALPIILRSLTPKLLRWREWTARLQRSK